MEIARSSDLLSGQFVVSNEPYYLICADDKLGCSLATQGTNDSSALGVQSSTAMIPSFAIVITVEQTCVSFLELKSDSSCHSSTFLVFRIWISLFLDYWFNSFIQIEHNSNSFWIIKPPRKDCGIVQSNQPVLQISFYLSKPLAYLYHFKGTTVLCHIFSKTTL